MKILKGFTLSLVFLLFSCGTTTKFVASSKKVNLKNKIIVLQLGTSSGAVTISAASLSNLSVGHAMSGEEQALIAANNLAFELRFLGLKLTNNSHDADIIATFSIGTIRYDPITGWIADQAYLEFIDLETGDFICGIKAKPRFITPTVENMIKNIINSLSSKL